MFCIDLLEKYRVLRSVFVVLFKFPKQTVGQTQIFMYNGHLDEPY